jgi:hypothetical protein
MGSSNSANSHKDLQKRDGYDFISWYNLKDQKISFTDVFNTITF